MTVLLEDTMRPINDSHQSNAQLYRFFLERLRAVREDKTSEESGKAQDAHNVGKKSSAAIDRPDESDRGKGRVRVPVPGFAESKPVLPEKGTKGVLGQVIRQVNQLIRELDEDGDRKLTAAELGGKQVTFAPRGDGPDVTIPLTTGAEPAQIVTSAATLTRNILIQVKGNLGQRALAIASGTTSDYIAAAINGESQSTGVVATTSGAALILKSQESGSDAFVSVTPIQGDLFAPQGQTVEDHGEDGTIIGDLDRNGDAELDRRELVRAYLQAIENAQSDSISLSI